MGLDGTMAGVPFAITAVAPSGHISVQAYGRGPGSRSITAIVGWMPGDGCYQVIPTGRSRRIGTPVTAYTLVQALRIARDWEQVG